MSQHDHHHDHSHAESEDNYYLDQMCLVAVAAAFGAVCLSLYFWRTDILKAMLAPQFFPYVLGSGVVLVILAVLRGAALWIKVGAEPVHDHDHDHAHAAAALASLPLAAQAIAVAKATDASACAAPGHDCGHDHGGGHIHSHADGHSHGHAHGHDDHDHSWNPIRYIALLVPIVLFLVGIPNKPPNVKAVTPEVDHSREAMSTTSWIGLNAMPHPLAQAAGVLTAASKAPRSGAAQTMDFQFMEDSATKPDWRKEWAGKFVRVWGQYVPNKNPNNDRVFSLGRSRINCCRQDAVPLNVPIVSSEGIRHVKPSEWIKVTGEIQYRKDDKGIYHTQLMVHGKDDVVLAAPDPDPYIR